MRARHALEHALLQSTDGLRSGCSLRLTVKCVPQVRMCRSRGMGMAKVNMTKADLHYEVHLSRPQLAPAAAMLPPPPRPPTCPSFCRVLLGSLQFMALCGMQV